ncbi:MerR family transcriptional regulator [Limnochorda pilosa]|uniref:MerR family transcriptional regulator n=1 Tax=Limnochorda pilosa TaxID=1555112 RepID=A0A0K2SNX3_LIMPI|nr:MerR family transcriptional regulator [Limnochorda pilosa]BAS28801.1 MerR family transcriptional regulator [Limnochorda pilosa]
MALRNCVRCGRLTDGRLGSLCPQCQREDAEAFEAVVDYLRDHPEANLMEVSQATGVDADHIRRFLREGRLELVGDPDALQCERCGASISTGRLCSDCTRAMEQAAAAQTRPPVESRPSESPARFHLGRHWLEERRERYRR